MSPSRTTFFAQTLTTVYSLTVEERAVRRETIIDDHPRPRSTDEFGVQPRCLGIPRQSHVACVVATCADDLVVVKNDRLLLVGFVTQDQEGVLGALELEDPLEVGSALARRNRWPRLTRHRASPGSVSDHTNVVCRTARARSSSAVRCRNRQTT